MTPTLAFSCTHAPFAHPHALDFLSDLIRIYKPRRRVHLGDEIDAHGWSRHDREADGPGQADELNQAVAWLRKLYAVVGDRVDCCVSNHTWRHLAAANRAGLPSRFLRDIRDVIEAPRGWRWHDHLILDGVRFEHGDRYGGQWGHVQALSNNRQSTVIGHIHSFAGVAWRHNGDGKPVFAVNAGCLVDPTSFGMRYARRYKHAPTLGAVTIVDGVPQFHPLKG